MAGYSVEQSGQTLVILGCLGGAMAGMIAA